MIATMQRTPIVMMEAQTLVLINGGQDSTHSQLRGDLRMRVSSRNPSLVNMSAMES